MDADGDFLVSWSSYGQDGSGWGIYAQRYNAAGVAQGGEFRVNSNTASDQLYSSVAMDADGDFLVSWSSYFQDGSDFGVYAQRYVQNAVANVAPTVTLSGPATAGEGQTKSYSFTTTDPGSNSFTVIATAGGAVGTVSNLVFDLATGAGSFDVTFIDNAAISTVAIQVADSDGALSNISTIDVAVSNDSPTPVIESISAVRVEGTSITVTASATDPAGANDTLTYSYAVFKNGGATVFAGASGVDQTSFSFTPDEFGSYQVVLTVSDEDGGAGTATANIIVTDDDEIPPVIILGGSTGNETDGQTQLFSWSISDASGIASSEVSMTRNGGGFFASILPSGSFNFDAYGPGTYVMTVTATDADNDRLGDSLTTITTRTVIVTDDDESPPVLALGGSSGTQTDAETQVFTWNISDASGLAASEVLMHQNGGGMYGGILPSSSFNFDAYGLGTFVMSVTATDADNDWNIGGTDSLSAAATRTVTVIDDDDEGPAIILGGSTGNETDGQTQLFSWSISDASGIASSEVSMTRNGGGFFASILPSGSFNFDAYGPGTYVMTVTATDADNDRLGDSLTTITTRTVIVTDDDESPPVLALGGSSGTQTDAETQVFTWNISDASGLAASEVLMHQNGGGMYGGILPSSSFNFDAYGLGTFVMSVTATDADNDWNIGGTDSLSATATRTVTVIDDDDEGPAIILGGSTGNETEARRSCLVGRSVTLPGSPPAKSR